MSPDELSEIVYRELEREARPRNEFVEATTVTLAVIVLLYAGATFYWSDAFWNASGIHSAAMKLPGAPETWGALFAFFGIGVLVSMWRHWKRALVLSLGMLSLSLASLAVMIWRADDAYPRTIGSVILYGGIAVLLLHRMRLAWVS